MSSFGEDLPLLDKAKQRAREIINAYSTDDQFQVISHELRSRNQRLLNQEDAINQLEEIEITPEVSELSKILNRQKMTLEQAASGHNMIYLASDFQKNIFDLPLEEDTSYTLHLVPIQAVQQQNVSIDTCWFDAPVQMLNQNNELIIRIQNHGTTAAENIKLTIELDGQEKQVSSINIPPAESIIDTANITLLKAGWHQAVIRISDFPVQFDDTYYLSFYVDENVRVLSINQGALNRNLNAVFANNTFFHLDNQQVSNLNYSTFANYSLIILNEIESVSTGMAEEMKKYLSAGGKVIFFPDSEGIIESYNQFLNLINVNNFIAFEARSGKVSQVNTDEFIFADVFENPDQILRLPETQGAFSMTKLQGRPEEQLLGFRDGGSFLSKYKVDNGTLYLCAAPLDEKFNNIVRNAEVFVPLLYKAAISRVHTKPIAYMIGDEQLIELDNQADGSDRVYNFIGPSEFIPIMIPLGAKMLLDVNNQVKEAGFYDLFLSESRIGRFAFNYDRKESDLAFYQEDALAERIPANSLILDASANSDFARIIGETNQGIILWKWCIILALLFLAIEIFLIRFWKN
jgi:hypothetical protein